LTKPSFETTARPLQKPNSFSSLEVNITNLAEEWTEESHQVQITTKTVKAGSKGVQDVESPAKSPYGPAGFDIHGPQYGTITSKAAECIKSSYIQMSSSKTIKTMESPYGAPEFDLFGPQYGITTSTTTKPVDSSYTEVSYAQVTTSKTITAIQSPYGMPGFDLFGLQYGMTASTATKPSESSGSGTATSKSIDPVLSLYGRDAVPLFGRQYGIPSLSPDEDFYNNSDDERPTPSKGAKSTAKKSEPLIAGPARTRDNDSIDRESPPAAKTSSTPPRKRQLRYSEEVDDLVINPEHEPLPYSDSPLVTGIRKDGASAEVVQTGKRKSHWIGINEIPA
jgi:hypothetical protein